MVQRNGGSPWNSPSRAPKHMHFVCRVHFWCQSEEAARMLIIKTPIRRPDYMGTANAAATVQLADHPCFSIARALCSVQRQSGLPCQILSKQARFRRHRTEHRPFPRQASKARVSVACEVGEGTGGGRGSFLQPLPRSRLPICCLFCLVGPAGQASAAPRPSQSRVSSKDEEDPRRPKGGFCNLGG